MDEFLFDIAEEEEKEFELKQNTNFFEIEEKYKALKSKIKGRNKMHKGNFTTKRNQCVEKLYNLSENWMCPVQDDLECIKYISNENIEKYVENHAEFWSAYELEKYVKRLKIKMLTINEIFSSCQDIIDYYLEESIYKVSKKVVLDMSEMYEFQNVIEDVVKTIEPKIEMIDFSELTDQYDVSQHFITEWKKDVMFICNEVKI